MEPRYDFRIWKKRENQMVEGVTNLNPLLLDKRINKDADNYKIMQCTGTKDKNGKYIFEGDIIKDGFEHTRICVYEDISYKFPALKNSRYFNRPIANKLEQRKQGINKNLTYQDNISKKDRLEFEIIGNIYENAELLED